jgi:hypothetical protein
MAVQHSSFRPQVTPCAQWDGTNQSDFEELAALTAPSLTWSFSVDSSGSLVGVSSSPGTQYTVPLNSWVLGTNYVMDDASFQATYQVLSGAAPFTYVVDGS